ncbi:sialidase family protein, partial [Rugosimonospora acidiphila]|uniref:sialidase family protein n=1 Tax=Rugosimonospora acidiphila TaxID=556531 RepID=UPI0031F08D15
MPIPSRITALASRRRGFLPAVAALAGALLIATAAPASAAPAGAAHHQPPPPPPAPSLTSQVIYSPAQDAGYTCFRIPSIVKANDGTLLAFAEGRVTSCGDSGDIDVVLKRSTDGGKTWGPLQLINAGNGDTHDQPTAVVDSRTGRILLITNANPGGTSTSACAIPCDRTAYLQYSDDDGATWSAPRDITSQVKDPSWNEWFVTGPGHGLQLTEGPHKGRIVVGFNAESGVGTKENANLAGLVYSDDGGNSWHIGATDSIPYNADGTYGQKPQELSLAQLPGGGIYAAARETGGTDIGNRSSAVSRDGGRSFSTKFATIPDLVTPQVQGTVLTLQGAANQGRMLFSSPANTDLRKTMMIRSSYDNGRTWENADQGTV